MVYAHDIAIVLTEQPSCMVSAVVASIMMYPPGRRSTTGHKFTVGSGPFLLVATPALLVLASIRPPARKFQNGNLKIVATWIEQGCLNVEI